MISKQGGDGIRIDHESEIEDTKSSTQESAIPNCE
jgi:hypothetical protein